MILHARAPLRSLVVLSVGLSLPASAQFEARLATQLRGPQLQDEAATIDSAIDLRVRQALGDAAWADGALQTRVGSSGVTVQYVDLTLGTHLGGDPERALWLKVMPLVAARERLGFDPLLGFGSNVLPSANAFAAHAQLELGPWRAWLATQSALMMNDLTLEPERRFAPSAGVGYRTQIGLRADAMAAYYSLGQNPGLATQGIKAETGAAGVAARIEYARGETFAPLVDLERYRAVNEFRDLREAAWRPGGESARGYRFSVEAIAVRRDAERLGVSPGIAPVSGLAVQAQADASFRDVRAQLQLVQRDPVFVLSSFGMVPLLRALTTEASTPGPERFAGASVEGCFEATRLCPGATVRVIAPAHLVSSLSGMFGGELDQEVLVGAQGQVQLLPSGTDPSLVPSASLSLRWAPLAAVRVFGQVTGSYDHNRYYFADDASGVARFVPDEPWVFGGELALQLVL